MLQEAENDIKRSAGVYPSAYHPVQCLHIGHLKSKGGRKSAYWHGSLAAYFCVLLWYYHSKKETL